MDRGVCEHHAPLSQRCARCEINRFWSHHLTAKTTAQRQQALRQRRLEQGMTEVRGIYAKPEHHAAIKAYARKLAQPGRSADPEPHGQNVP